ncbi:MAG: hypothetical protein KKB20_04260 [Proteobacteria bacterium]|nr:hypothetical protein [Pseudomonadota bacterium]
MTELRKQMESLAGRIELNNRWRQQDCFNLIPSEMTPSLLVKICEISDPAGRYAEHRSFKGREVYFYQGTDFIRQVEEETREQMGAFFGSQQAELRPISGQMANEVVFKALLKLVNRDRNGPFRRLRTVLNNDLNRGGHISSQPMGALFGCVEMDPVSHAEHVLPIPVSQDNPYRADMDRLLERIRERRPELIIFGKSMFLYPEPVREAAEAAAELDHPSLIMFDMAHVLGLYGAFQSPLQEGAHIVTGSTHKTFFGPQRGVIVGDEREPWKEIWPEINSRSCPGATSNHHLGTLLGLLMAAYEMNAFKEAYQDQVIRNARAMARYAEAAGLDVEGDPSDGYTRTHQVIVRISRYGAGEEIARRLEDNHIIVNYQALPDDKTFLHSSGIRLGVQEMTRFGMVEADFETLAGLMAEVVVRNRAVKEAVKDHRRKFTEMKFTLPIKEAIPVAAGILRSILPSGAYAEAFAEALAGRV